MTPCTMVINEPAQDGAVESASSKAVARCAAPARLASDCCFHKCTRAPVSACAPCKPRPAILPGLSCMVHTCPNASAHRSVSPPLLTALAPQAAGLKHIGFGPFKRENQDEFFIQVGCGALMAWFKLQLCMGTARGAGRVIQHRQQEVGALDRALCLAQGSNGTLAPCITRTKRQRCMKQSSSNTMRAPQDPSV